MEPKRRRGFASQGRATRDLVAAAHSHQELLGSEGGFRIMDRSEEHIHCWGHAVPLPQRNALTQNTLPPCLRQVRQEDQKRLLSLYGGKSLDFLLVLWQEGLTGQYGYKCLKEKDSEEKETERMCSWKKNEFVFNVQKDSSLNTQVINNGMKEGDESTIRMG